MSAMETAIRASLTTGQAAKVLGCNSRTIRRWVDAGKVEGFVTPTGIRYVYQDALMKLIPASSYPSA